MLHLLRKLAASILNSILQEPASAEQSGNICSRELTNAVSGMRTPLSILIILINAGRHGWPELAETSRSHLPSIR